MAVSGFTAQEELDFYYLVRNVLWRYRLDLAEAAVITRVEALLRKMRRDFSRRIVRYAENSYTRARLRELLEELEIIEAAVRGQVGGVIAEASGVIGSMALDEQYDILSVGGQAAKVRAVSLNAADFGALFLTTPLGGELLQTWVDKAFSGGHEQLVSALQEGLFAGEGYGKLINRVLAEAENLTRREAVTLVRTYAQSASVSAQEAVYRQNRDIVGRVKWSAVLEPGYVKTGRGTCLRCSALDQQSWRQDEARPPCPLHPNCRCLLLPIVDWEKIGIPEMALDETVRPYTIRPDENIGAGGRREILEVGRHKGSYADWFDKRDEAFQLNVLGPGRYELYKQGMDFNGFVNPVTGKLYTLEELHNQHGASFIRLPPAPNMEEALRQVRSLGVEADFVHEDLGVARLVNYTLAEIKTYGYPLPERLVFSGDFFAGEPDASAAYVVGNDTLFLRAGLSVKQIAAEAFEAGNAGYWSTNKANHSILHELGHEIHYKNNSRMYLYSRNKNFAPIIEAIIIRDVSRYAASGGREFVAEVFVGLMDGKTYSQRIIQLYRLYGGLW